MKWITNWEVAAGCVERYFSVEKVLYRLQVQGFTGTTAALSLLTAQFNMGLEHNLGPALNAIERVGRFQFTLSTTGDALGVVEKPSEMPRDRIPLYADTEWDTVGPEEPSEPAKASDPPAPAKRASQPTRKFDEREINLAYQSKRNNSIGGAGLDLLADYEKWLKENNLPVTGQFVRLPASRRPEGEKKESLFRPSTRVNHRYERPRPSLAQLGDLGLAPKDMTSALTEAKRPERPKGTVARPGTGWYGLDLDQLIRMVEGGNGAAEAFLKGNIVHAYNVPEKSRSKEDKEIVQKYEAMLQRKGKKPNGGWVKLREGISREEGLQMTGGGGYPHKEADRKALARMDKLVEESEVPEHLKERYKKERSGKYDGSVVDKLTENTTKHPEGDPDGRIIDESSHYADGERADDKK